VSLENIEKLEINESKPLVALSFDDGYYDFYENALPILKEYNLPATHNICPHLIDKNEVPWTQRLSSYLQNNSSKNINLPNKETLQIPQHVNETFFMRICNRLYAIEDEKIHEWLNDLIGKSFDDSNMSKLMNWEMIRECSKERIHFGSHSLTHRNLAKIYDKINCMRKY